LARNAESPSVDDWQKFNNLSCTQFPFSPSEYLSFGPSDDLSQDQLERKYGADNANDASDTGGFDEECHRC